MHKAILIACVPCLIALVVSFVLLWLVVRISGARLRWGRLREVHSCQDGGVQSLAFVLTLPVFLIIVLFIVQVSQLMIGTMIVNYSAFAAARAACVWIPADLDQEDLYQNQLPAPITETDPMVLVSTSRELVSNLKYRKIFQAAALGCAPASPSRNYGFSLDPQSGPTADAAYHLYDLLAPQTRTNPKIHERIHNKVAYAWQNTAVRVEFRDKDTRRGPTYNPRDWVELDDGRIIEVWNPHEVGWQDPITVTVTHNFALIPGPGRLLAKFLVRSDGRPDRISPRITSSSSPGNEQLYTTPIWASATMTNEGFKSQVPYVHSNSD